MKSKNCTVITLLMILLPCLPSGSYGQDINGNPLPHFLFPSFSEGVVKMKDGTRFITLLDYNMVEEKMITELNGVYRYSKDPKTIDTIYLENRVFVPMDNVFYEVLSTGPATFFLENKSNATPKGSDVGYGVKSRSVAPTQYRRFELTQVIYQYGSVVNIDLPPNIDITPASLFWVRKNDSFEKFSNERQFLKIFPEYENELKQFIKENHLSLKSREDVIRLGDFTNELISKASKK